MNFLFSPFLAGQSKGKKIAFIALFTAINAIANLFFEIKILDIQYSLTIVFSCLTGIFLGPVFGFVSCFVGDLVGFFINSWGYLYMFWVGLSTAMFAFISGIIFSLKYSNKQQILKIAIYALASFLVCTILINSTGFYIYNRGMGFSESFLSYVESKTGNRNAGFMLYLGYRLFFKGQIYNSLVNYFLLFILIPLINNKLIGHLISNSNQQSQVN